jgi:hypothetical protein
MLGNLDLKSAYSGARLAADKALVIDPNSSEAICAEAWLQMVCRRNWDRSRVLFNRISSGEPTNTRVTVGRALLHIVTGDCKVASNLLYLASQQSSLSGLSLGLHSWSDYLAGDFSEAMDHVSQAWGSGRRNPIVGVVEALTCIQLMHGEDAIQRVGTRIQEDPKNDVVRGALGYLYGTNGREESARRILHDLNREHSHARENSHYAIALVYLGIGEVSQAVQSLERSYEEGSLWSLALHLDPALRSLAGHPEFERFINKAYPATEMP